MPHDRPSLGTFLAIALTSDADGEVVTAIRHARKILKVEGRGGNDVAQALEQYGKLADAARELRAENDELRAENERLKQLQHANGAGSSFAQQLWQPVGMPLTVSTRTAQWLLDLEGQGRIHLTTKEAGLVRSCTRRRTPLSPAQRDWLKDITDHAIASTGLTPPP